MRAEFRCEGFAAMLCQPPEILPALAPVPRHREAALAAAAIQKRPRKPLLPGLLRFARNGERAVKTYGGWYIPNPVDASAAVIPEMPEALSGIVTNAASGFRDEGRGTLHPDLV